MPKPTHLLVVEDEAALADLLKYNLEKEGYRVSVATDGEEALVAANENPPDLVLLDWMLPKRDGQTICRNLRAMGITTPILMVTARDQVSDRVSGLDTGADDYLVKPFAVEELIARVRALARRESSVRAAKLTAGPYVVDSVAQTASVDGAPVRLTQREFSLLEALVRNPGRTLTREAILLRVWNADETLPNTVNFHMKSLRRKVDPEGKWIQTIHGFGYVLRTDGVAIEDGQHA